MYSVVLLMAITTGGESADGRGCRSGCSCGCYCGGCRACRGCRRGCHAGCYGCYSYACHGCYGGYGGCHVTYGGCYGGSSACHAVTYSAPITAGCAAGHLVSSRVLDSGTAVASQTDPGTAMLVVSVPTDAKVSIDGQATVSTTATRYFQTPTLTAGKTYGYTLEAAFVKDGAPVKVSKTVTFKAGDTVRLDLTSDTAVARK
ncbi:MAG: TIGR03000 domain-containing protein [Gemmataceae bacterium]